MQPGTYIRPHWHLYPPKDESVIVLQGELAVFIFDDQGQVQQTFRLAAGSPNFGIDIVAGVCHTFLPLAEDTVMFEVKPGPYVRATDKDFASWAPADGEPGVEAYVTKLLDWLA